jgi:single-strand DNA-binding protein
MAEGLNRVMLLGNLGADPELRFTQGGQAVLNMRIATTETYLDKNKVRQERTDWHNVVVWGKRGEALAKFLAKGSSLFVEGSLRTSSYDDRDGNKRYKTEIIANNVLLTGSRGGRGAPTEDYEASSFGGGGEEGGAGGAGGGARGYGGGSRSSGGGPRPQSGGGGAPRSGAAPNRPAAPQDAPPAASDDYGYDGGNNDDIPF